MHTAEELTGRDFEYRSGGEVVARETVMPAVTPADRVGVVMGAGTDGLGAGNFVLSCITAFYDHLRATTGEFFEYPDYYTFQVTAEPADYGMLDIYPDHKNVSVEPDDEQLLRAISDRAITVLLVPDVPPTTPAVEDITRRSVARWIEDCYVYAADGRPADAEFAIGQPREPAEDWYETTANSVAAGTDTLPSFGPHEDRIVQHFRHISLEAALSRLPTAEDRAATSA